MRKLKEIYDNFNMLFPQELSLLVSYNSPGVLSLLFYLRGATLQRLFCRQIGGGVNIYLTYTEISLSLSFIKFFSSFLVEIFLINYY